MSAKLKYTGYSDEKPRCIDAVSTALREEGFRPNLVGEDQKRKMLDEAVNNAWKKNDSIEIEGLHKRLVDMKVKNLGEIGAKEVLGKLAVWFTFVRLG